MRTINPRYIQACRRKLNIPAEVLTYPTYQRRTFGHLATTEQPKSAPQPTRRQRNPRVVYGVYAACMVGVLVVASLSSAGV